MEKEQEKSLRYVLTCVFLVGLTFPIVNNLPILIKAVYPEFLKCEWLRWFDGYIFEFLQLALLAAVFAVAYFLIGRKFKPASPDKSGTLGDCLGILSIICFISLVSDAVRSTVSVCDGLFETCTGSNNIVVVGSASFPSFLISVIIVPLVEEFACRQVVFKLVRPYGAGVAILVSTICFAFAHGTTYQVFSILIAGLSYGIIREKYGLWASIALHAINNFVSFSALIGGALLYILFLAMCIVTIVGTIYFVRNYMLQKKNIEMWLANIKSCTGIILTTPTLYVLLAACIANIVLVRCIYG